VAGVTETGYSVQLGAFSVLSNAVRLTERLRGLGEDVYTFRHESGLYKVRLGDFPSRDAAEVKAMDLVGRGLVDVFYIVGPSDYALARSRMEGTDVLREAIVRTASGFIGLPYQWGGTSPEEGFDCSGLTMAAYQMNGLNIPRSSREQFIKGRVVGQGDVKKGDLVFFSIRSGRKVSHVGIYAGDGTFIHAPGTGKDIRVESLSNAYFQKCYVGARSFI
jgi:cell wall-associated NlpC family hydrolase